jgi:transposase
MGKTTRKRYSADFKTKVALDAIRGEMTVAQLTAKHGIHQTMISDWKKQAIEGLSTVFQTKPEGNDKTKEAEIEKLHAKIGQLIVERDFLVKVSGR